MPKGPLRKSHGLTAFSILLIVFTILFAAFTKIPWILDSSGRLFAMDHQWKVFSKVSECESTSAYVTIEGHANKHSVFFNDRHTWRQNDVRRENYFFLNNFQNRSNPVAQSYMLRWCAKHGLRASDNVTVHLECRKWNPNSPTLSIQTQFGCRVLNEGEVT